MSHSRKVSVSARSRAVKNPLSLPARIGLLLLILMSNLPLIASASAATITVGNTGDPTTSNAANCNAADTCTLRDAIAKAADVTGTAAGDTIVFNLPANSTITLSGSELLVDRNLTIDGSASPNLAISGNNASRVFEINTSVAATLKQLVIKNGKVNFFGGGGSGGGIYNSGLLTLTHSTISSNTAGSEGGGIFNYGTLTLTDNTVVGNIATWGGGICNLGYGTLTLVDSDTSNNTADWGGGIYNSGIFTLTNSMVSGNTASGGGGIYNLYGTTLTQTGSTISDNTAGIYGGIYNSGTLTLTDSTVSGNTATQGDGGGIFNEYGPLTLTSSTVSDNTANHGGGGIYNGYDTTLTLTGSTVSGNTSSLGGGGIINYHTVMMTNSTVSGNTTVGNGGGIVNYDTLTLTNSTITDNTTDSAGGGIFNDYGALTLIHDTLSGNTAAGADDDIYNGPYYGAVSVVNTIIQSCAADGGNTAALTDNGGNLDGGNGCGFTDASSKSNATLDLGVLANNGGPTLTMMPGASSDAIGRGLPATCRNAPTNSRDQRGYVHPAVGCTSGAVDPNGLANDSIFFNGFGFGGQ